MMAHWMQSGAIADLVLAVMVLEGIALLVFRSHFRGLHAAEIVSILGAGLFLVLALRAALTGAGWPWIALFLTAAFAAHLLDLRRRLGRRSTPPPA